MDLTSQSRGGGQIILIDGPAWVNFRVASYPVRPKLDSGLSGELSDFTPVPGLPNAFCIKAGSLGRSRFDMRTRMRNRWGGLNERRGWCIYLYVRAATYFQLRQPILKTVGNRAQAAKRSFRSLQCPAFKCPRQTPA